MHRLTVCVIVATLGSLPLQAYSVLTHEAIIDSTWDRSIRPLLLRKYPAATADELRDAHAYVYGGCIIQDMGYYPFGSRFYTDLTHYVRSGDFVANLLREAQNLNEYAFALGALAHYAADTQGHSVAVNRSVPIIYPKLQRKFGRIVTYADDHTSHLRVEFSFDVTQVAGADYRPQSYHDFIGFEVAKPVLERAFRDTYSLDLKDIFGDLDLALSTYRYAVSKVIPELTRNAWKMKKDELIKAHPGLTRRQYVYRISKAEYRKQWNQKYRGPGPFVTVLAFLVRIAPKIGPLRVLAYQPPTAQTAKLFQESFERTHNLYRELLQQHASGSLHLENCDFDTGKPTAPAEYQLADNTYAELVRKLADRNGQAVDPDLRRNLLEFYRNLDAPFATKQKPKDWELTVAAIDKLRHQAVAVSVPH